MTRKTRSKGSFRSAYAGLDFIKAAFCPLEFRAKKLGEHPEFQGRTYDKALDSLGIGDELKYAREFPYTNAHGHRKTGTQIVTAPFGLAPRDFDLFLGLYSYIKRNPELLCDGRLHQECFTWIEISFIFTSDLC